MELGMNPLVSKFFAVYEKSIAEAAVATIAELYSDVFTFGGPRGAQSIKKEDFLKVLPGRKTYFKSIGLEDSRVGSIDEITLDARYILARVVWKMTLKTSADDLREFEAKTTYILEIKNETPVIIMQLDHQDLGEKVNEMRAT